MTGLQAQATRPPASGAPPGQKALQDRCCRGQGAHRAPQSKPLQALQQESEKPQGFQLRSHLARTCQEFGALINYDPLARLSPQLSDPENERPSTGLAQRLALTTGPGGPNRTPRPMAWSFCFWVPAGGDACDFGRLDRTQRWISPWIDAADPAA